jgi:hypothetical protein
LALGSAGMPCSSSNLSQGSRSIWSVVNTMPRPCSVVRFWRLTATFPTCGDNDPFGSVAHGVAWPEVREGSNPTSHTAYQSSTGAGRGHRCLCSSHHAAWRACSQSHAQKCCGAGRVSSRRISAQCVAHHSGQGDRGGEAALLYELLGKPIIPRTEAQAAGGGSANDPTASINHAVNAFSIIRETATMGSRRRAAAMAWPSLVWLSRAVATRPARLGRCPDRLLWGSRFISHRKVHHSLRWPPRSVENTAIPGSFRGRPAKWRRPLRKSSLQSL